MRWVKNSATTASTARIASAARSPSSRASAYASTSRPRSPGRPGLSSAASRSASETNGTPPASSTCACASRSAGSPGSAPRSSGTPRPATAIMIEPASAVPIEAPRFVIVFWTPPTSGLWSSGTADTVTAPSCEASAPIPRPMSSIGTKTTSGAGVRVERAEQYDACRRAARAARRGRRAAARRREEPGIPSAAASSVIESGSRRTPVSIADSPSATERKSGTTKKMPACTRYWKKNIVRPPSSWRFRSIAGRTSGSSPRDSSRASQRKKSQITSRPPSTSHIVGERPAHEARPPSAGSSPTRWSAARRTPASRGRAPRAQRRRRRAADAPRPARPRSAAS